MKKTELNHLSKLVKNVGSYKPEEAPKKQDKAPSSKELNRKYTLNLKKVKISEK
tara:strand:+ start:298 stop:459 length:162 start_codon:yes stop_codon:yes gene_type:complete